MRKERRPGLQPPAIKALTVRGESKSMLSPLTGEGLTIEPGDGQGPGADVSIRLTWKGRSGARNPAELLAPYFRNVLQVAADRRPAPVEMRFEQLEHFNSSTVAVSIHLIQQARSQQVPLVFVYDQSLKWQKLSFDAMRVFVKSDGLLQLRSV